MKDISLLEDENPSFTGISCKCRKLEKISFSTFSKIINHIKLFPGNISLDGSNKVLLTIKSEARKCESEFTAGFPFPIVDKKNPLEAYYCNGFQMVL